MDTYIVGGRQRCGSSGVMHCMGLGGLELFYSEEKEKENKATYLPEHNPYYYEADKLRVYKGEVEDLPGKCIKLFGIQPLRLPPSCWPMHIVYMQRDPAAQRISFGSMGHVLHDYERTREEDIVFLSNHPGVQNLTIVDYETLVEEPLAVFQALANVGWPIDPEKAASGVDPSLKHY